VRNPGLFSKSGGEYHAKGGFASFKCDSSFAGFPGGCPAPVPDSSGWTNDSFSYSRLIAYCEDKALDEHDYFPWTNIPIDKIGQVYGYINLTYWDGDYGLEILLMTMDGFAAYDSGESFSAWHRSVYTEGYYSFEFINVTPGSYALVVDNTNWGWEATDFDFVNDYAVFDFEAYFEPY